MNRRELLAAAASLAAATALPAPLLSQREPNRTRWAVRTSEGFDALCFLAPLSGGELYLRYYADEAEEFGARLPDAVRADIPAIWREAGDDGYGLLGPNLCTALSGGDVSTIDGVVAMLEDPEALIRPAFEASPYWSEVDWAWLTGHAPRLAAILAAMRDAGFAEFRVDRMGADIDDRVARIRSALDHYDVVRWQEKLTGRVFDPGIGIVLLQFSKPHGIKVQGQNFLQAMDYTTATTVRIAAHEMLHPPLPMDGAAATAAMAVLGADPLVDRIVREHDPRWGYTTLEGLLNEDMCEALDQLISEALGVARNPADRWRNADDGMHVLAGALYGMLREDRWTETGGDIEQWLADATAAGRLAPERLHPVAARVLERPVDALWPIPATEID
ncbi:MAG: hypothetical protein RLN87_01940 [Parasphingopyxis sp.]|uniref:hypothetical protein n=1 Tax=Parasphingopyxis sp. TaxID=1920299 RepID=UPI0032EE87C5